MRYKYNTEQIAAILARLRARTERINRIIKRSVDKSWKCDEDITKIYGLIEELEQNLTKRDNKKKEKIYKDMKI